MEKQIVKEVDPIGLDLIMSILSTIISSVSFVFQVKSMDGKPRIHYKSELEQVKKQLNNLEAEIDKYSILFSNVKLEGSKRLEDRSLTIRDTKMLLKLNDYKNWRNLDSRIKNIQAELSVIISKCRKEMMFAGSRDIKDSKLNQITDDFDSLMENLSSSTHNEFIKESRILIGNICGWINE